MSARIAGTTLLALLLLLFAGSSRASADLADETALAEHFAPVLSVGDRPRLHGRGEPYLPMDIDTLFDNNDGRAARALGRQRPGQGRPQRRGAGGDLFDYHLDFPGDALDPGCGYLDWSRRADRRARAAAVYAHVATDPDHPGQLALQYWMFYVFNDWNNLHEGDWEMIQLNFDAADRARRLDRDARPRSATASTRAARAPSWGDAKLEKVDGTHPVVYPAAGSHAELLRLGAVPRRVRRAGRRLRRHAQRRGSTSAPTCETIPSDTAAARRGVPVDRVRGALGRAAAGVLQRPDRAEPEDAVDAPDHAGRSDWRDRAYAVPGGGVLGTDTTDFFCGAIAARLAAALARDRPTRADRARAARGARRLWCSLRAGDVAPAAPLRLARRRAWGQILAASARMYSQPPAAVHRHRAAADTDLAVIDALLQAVVLGRRRASPASTRRARARACSCCSSWRSAPP